jgi:hypothetical protein
MVEKDKKSLMCIRQIKGTTRNWIELNENVRAVRYKNLMPCRKG